jgi:hypothetical protein
MKRYHQPTTMRGFLSQHKGADRSRRAQTKATAQIYDSWGTRRRSSSLWFQRPQEVGWGTRDCDARIKRRV